VAQSLNCTARRLVFTSGGSEANNLALKGVAHSGQPRRHLITTGIEHPAILATCRALAANGFEVTILPVDNEGLVLPATLAGALRPDTLLVSIMTANNETGTIQPIADLAEIAHQHGALFHTDAVQALGKIALDVEESRVDLLSISSHKVYGPKGMGALYIRKGVELAPLIHGGGQEHAWRSGTENVAGIVGFGMACQLSQERLLRKDGARIAAMRDRLEQGILELVEGAVVNGCRGARLANTLNLTLPSIRGESLVLLLDRSGVCFSSGSACKSGSPAPSAALLAMGLSEEEAHCAVRFSLGKDNTEDDIDYTLACLKQALNDTFSALRFVACR
jgi:cysteine sulfinate desulfinase/cysteine desulfurase-like protein